LKQVKLLGHIDELKQSEDKTLVIVWHNDREEIFKQHGIDYLNLLDNIWDF